MSISQLFISFTVAKETLEGHQRAMMGNMTVEEIYRERKTFSNAVFEVSKKDFVKFGMSIISYTLKDITDEVGYLKVFFYAMLLISILIQAELPNLDTKTIVFQI